MKVLVLALTLTLSCSFSMAAGSIGVIEDEASLNAEMQQDENASEDTGNPSEDSEDPSEESGNSSADAATPDGLTEETEDGTPLITSALSNRTLMGLLGVTADAFSDEPVMYMNEHGEYYTHVDCIPLDDSYSGKTLGNADWATWYFVPEGETVTWPARVTVQGEVTIILCDGSILNANNGISVKVGNSFTVYAQSMWDGVDVGKLKAVSTGSSGSAIGGNHGSNINRTTTPVNSVSDAGDITINGGDITADASSSQYDSGIGGGHSGDCGNITINNGKVIAKGYDNGSYSATGDNGYAAGIGGGAHGSGGTIKIYDGDVTAISGQFAAGIGAGGTNKGGVNATHRTCSGGTIEIYGGTVSAECKSGGGAGIGGGSAKNETSPVSSLGSAGIIKISGGTVTATGSGYGSGIGGGAVNSSITGDGGDIYITGGTVDAAGGSDGAGIGGGGAVSSGSLTIDWSDETDPAVALPRITATSYSVATLTPKHPFAKNGEIQPKSAEQIMAFTDTTIIPCEGNLTADGSARYKVASVDPVTFAVTKTEAEKPCTEFTVVGPGGFTGGNMPAGWYAVTKDVTVNGRINISGTVNLILCDGATLTLAGTEGGRATVGIGVNNGETLNVYGFEDEIKTKAGKIYAANSTTHTAVIGGTGDGENDKSGTNSYKTGAIRIHGGVFDLQKANTSSCGIGAAYRRTGGSVYIYDGWFDIAQYSGSAIGGAYHSRLDTLIIYDGVFNCRSYSSGNAIGGGSDCDYTNKNAWSMYIYGGNIKATRSSGGGIGGDRCTTHVRGGVIDTDSFVGSGVKLYWSKKESPAETPRITAGSYGCTVTYNNSLEAFANEADPDTVLTAAQVKALTNQTIIPKENGLMYLDVTVSSDHKVSKGSAICGTYTPVTSSDSTWGTDGETSWYAVTEDTSINGRVTVKGTVNLILKNDTTLSLDSGGIGVHSGNTLKIYQQPVAEGEERGKLSAKAVGLNNGENAGIGGSKESDAGTIIINGGEIAAQGPSSGNMNAPGIGSANNGDPGTIEINDGIVTSTSQGLHTAGLGGGGNRSGGTITINGGKVNASALGSSANGAGIGGGGAGVSGADVSGGTISVYGGEVTASSNGGGAGIGGGSSANSGMSFNKGAGIITIKGGRVKATSTNGAGVGGGGRAAEGSLTLDWSDVTDPFNAKPEIFASSYALGSISYTDQSRPFALKGANTALTTNEIKALTSSAIIPKGGVISYLDVTVSADHKVSKETQDRELYYIVGSSDSTWGSAGAESWYAVTEDTTISGRVTAAGNVNLILCNGMTLTTSNGIQVESGNSLTIYQQPVADGEDMGRLVASTRSGSGTTEQGHAGIGGNNKAACGTITINGGDISARGEPGTSVNTGSAAIGSGAEVSGGTIVINGGKVTASSDMATRGAGIGSGGKYNNVYNLANNTTVEINGGTIDAVGGGCSAGIGGGEAYTGGTVSIYGGDITADGGTEFTGGGSAGIGGGWNGNGGTIRIYGGEITATGSTHNGGATGAGIGGGINQSGGNIYICGGIIHAASENGECGIGAGQGNTNAVIELDWTEDTFSSTEITASNYIGTVSFIKPYVLKSDTEEAAWWKSDSSNNIDATAIIPGFVVTDDLVEGRKYTDSGFTAGEDSVTLPVNEAFTARYGVEPLMSAMAELEYSLSDFRLSFTDSSDDALDLPEGTLLTLTAAKVESGTVKYTHYYAITGDNEDSLLLSEFAGYIRRGSKFRPDPGDKKYLVSVKFPDGTDTSGYLGAKMELAAVYTKSGSTSKKTSVIATSVFTLDPLAAITASAGASAGNTMNVTVSTQPPDSKLLADKKVYLVGSFRGTSEDATSDLQLMTASCTPSGASSVSGVWIAEDTVAFALGSTYGSSGDAPVISSPIEVSFTHSEDMNGDEYDVKWKLCTGSDPAGNIVRNEISNTATVSAYTFSETPPSLSAASPSGQAHVLESGSTHPINFTVTSNRPYKVRVEKQTALHTFVEVSGSASSEYPKTNTAVTVTIPAEAGTYRVCFSMDGFNDPTVTGNTVNINDNDYETFIVEDN